MGYFKLTVLVEGPNPSPEILTLVVPIIACAKRLIFS